MAPEVSFLLYIWMTWMEFCFLVLTCPGPILAVATIWGSELADARSAFVMLYVSFCACKHKNKTKQKTLSPQPVLDLEYMNSPACGDDMLIDAIFFL